MIFIRNIVFLMSLFPLMICAQNFNDKIELFEKTDSLCTKKDSKMIFVHSKDMKQTIEVHLDRYFQNVRQPGRSVVLLEPDSEAHKLGCSRVLADAAEQNWKVVDVRIVHE